MSETRRKKLAVIGRGTAGCLSISHFQRWTDWDIDWYFDPNIKPQAVGEGSTALLPNVLFENLNFTITELETIYGTLKGGIKKFNWGKVQKEFIHPFPGNVHGYHFNAVKLQELIIDKLKKHPRVKFKEQNVEEDSVDSDFVMNCSGAPKESDDRFEYSNYIPVNSAYVTQCYWEGVKFEYTLTIARPYGWVFGIPLLNRCSIGYMFNSTINNVDEVKEDVKHVFEQFKLTPSQDTNFLRFNNYYRKQNSTGRCFYNGNASFFLEPLEATSISFMNQITKTAHEHWYNKKTLEVANDEYLQSIKHIENVIMLHYAAGSTFNTDFWSFAQQRGRDNFFKFIKSDTFKSIRNSNFLNVPQIGTWPPYSFNLNIKNLGLSKYLNVL